MYTNNKIIKSKPELKLHPFAVYIFNALTTAAHHY